MLVMIPSSQPRMTATMMIQASEAWLVPAIQLTFTWRVFSITSARTTTSSATDPNAQA